jgi:hypothetical protein
MRKHASKEAFYQRLQDLAEVKKPSLKESRNLGTLIDYKRAADGLAYGIIKEQHHYYIKKAGTKQDLNVADFAYIGGLANITEFQYKSLSEADKQRNMIFRTISESVSTKVSKTGSKKKLNEDKAGEEIDAAASKVGDLDAATAAAELPPDTGGEEEMAAGLEAEPTVDGGEEISAEELPAPEGGEEKEPAGEELPEPEGGEEKEPEGGEEKAAKGGEEEIPATGDNIAPATDVDAEPGEELDDLQQKVSDVAMEIKGQELPPEKLGWYLQEFINKAFLPAEEGDENKMAKISDDTRHEVADKILKVVPSKDIEGIAKTVPQDVATGDVEEEACVECGGFGKYAESRGYSTPQAFMECGEEEQGNVISGYANAHNDGMNDGDIKLVALLINPEMLEKLKSEYGHDEYAEKLAPEVNSLAECKLEEREAQINELWGGLKSAFGKVGGDIKAGAQKAGQAVGGAIQKGAQAVAGAAQKGAQAVGQYAQGVKQQYHAGEVPAEIKKLTDDAMALGKQIAALNTRLQKAGKQPVNVQSLLTTIKNQLGGAAGAVNLSKYGVAEGITDPANVPVQPTMLKEDDEPEEEEIEKTDVEIGKPEGEEIETPEEFDTPEVDDTKDGAIGAGTIGFAPEQSLGGGVMKPDGAGVEIEITPDKTVKIEMSESEKKLRKYIRERLEVKAGIRKEKLTESKKSETLKKLDKVIDEQFKLYESVVLKKKVNEDSAFGDFIQKGVNKIVQGSEGRLKTKRQMVQALPNITSDSEAVKWLQALYSLDTAYNKALERYISAAPNQLEILQQIAADSFGVGKLKWGGDKLVYIPADKA